MAVLLLYSLEIILVLSLARNSTNLWLSFLTLCITALLSSTLFKWKIHQNLKAWLKRKKHFIFLFSLTFGINIAVFSSATVFCTLGKIDVRDLHVFLKWKRLVCGAAVS